MSPFTSSLEARARKLGSRSCCMLTWPKYMKSQRSAMSAGLASQSTSTGCCAVAGTDSSTVRNHSLQVQSCRGAKVQRCRSAEVQWCSGAEVERCSGAEV